MTILETLVQLRDDLKTWVTNNLNALNSKIEEKTIPIDNELSSTSTNPVQNKAISAEISSLNNLVGNTPVATQISTAIANQEHFSGDYNDLTNAPNISEDGSGNMVIADEDGNIIFKADADGIHTTDVEVAGTSLGAKISIWDAKSDFSGDYNDLENAPDILEDGDGNLIIADESGNIIFQVDETGVNTTAIKVENQDILSIMDNKIADLVDSSPDTLNTLNELAAALGDDPNFATTVAGQIGGKVDKVDGMGLSETSFTAAEKTKLSNIEDGATKTVIDGELSSTSENPVQSKAIYAKLDELTGMEPVSEQISNAIEAIEYPVTSVNGHTGDVILQYEDIENAPNIYEDSSNELVITDPDGNIIFRSDGAGLETTTLTAQTVRVGESEIKNVDSSLSIESTNPVQNKVVAEAIGAIKHPVTSVNEKTGNVVLTASDVGALPDTTEIPSIEGLATETYVNEKVSGLVNAAPETLNTLDELAAALGDDANFAATVTEQIGTKTSTTEFNAHVNETDGKNKLHITAAERTSWNAKSNFSGDYSDLTNAPNIQEDESGKYTITDESGNIVFEINSNENGATNVYDLVIQGTPIADYVILTSANVDYTILAFDTTAIVE